jgi:hypothetical protein
MQLYMPGSIKYKLALKAKNLRHGTFALSLTRDTVHAIVLTYADTYP